MLNSLYEQYRDQAAFFVIYIREAHPRDLWQMAINVRENVVFNDPKSFADRTSLAERCVRKLGIRIPTLVDDIGDGVEAAYTGWPDRLYVIDRAGHIAYKGEPGPFGFEPGAIEDSLRQAIGESRSLLPK